MSESFKQRFLSEAGERPYAWALSKGLSKDLVTAVVRGSDDYRPIKRTLEKLAYATGKTVQWWLTGEDGRVDSTASSDPAAGARQSVAGTIVAGSGRVDIALLEAAMEALAKFEAKRGVTIEAERRSAVIALLYDILAQEEDGSESRLETMFRAIM